MHKARGKCRELFSTPGSTTIMRQSRARATFDRASRGNNFRLFSSFFIKSTRPDKRVSQNLILRHFVAHRNSSNPRKRPGEADSITSNCRYGGLMWPVNETPESALSEKPTYSHAPSQRSPSTIAAAYFLNSLPPAIPETLQMKSTRESYAPETPKRDSSS